MKDSGAILAGEMSGHTFIKDNWFGFDDGIYAGARMLEILSHESQSIQEALSSLPKSFSTPEINIEVNEGEQHKIINSLQKNAKFSKAKEIIMIDGLRVEYDTGFGLMRASNTTPVIVLRFEAETQQDLIQIQADFKAVLQPVINSDHIPF